ncbi:MAG: hypothetical protein KTR29_15575 [Rhodothermaceae bacterium]|nr:hypothetical protein [Rhodothermaceae bacterium]
MLPKLLFTASLKPTILTLLGDQPMKGYKIIPTVQFECTTAIPGGSNANAAGSTSGSQLMTRRRRDAMRKLDRWMATLLTIARRALQDDPKQLVKLGITVKNA